MKMENISDDAMLMVVISGLWPQFKFWRSVHESGPKTYHEFLQQAEKFISAEEATVPPLSRSLTRTRKKKEMLKARKRWGARRKFQPTFEFRPFDESTPWKPFQKSPQVHAVY